MSSPMPERAWTAPSRPPRRTSRPSAPGARTPRCLQKVLVDYYGSPTPLAQLASLNNPEARTLVVNPYDKSALKAIEQAIRDMPNLGVNPTNDGTIVRVTMPELTEDRRKEYVKIVRGKGEDAKVQVRNLRRKAKDDLDALKSDVGEDELVRAEKELDVVTRAHVDAIDEALKRKEA
ncbi:hypothetical protein LUZ63_023605 [Rhynchospora breviuscula]|uniref:Ribosome-recycling factor, chloroplastic n=1 Tax=Rhynchospora breviuscula TaxID=2022672 RepID=A0A9P9Z2J2_9POAL|nr:hypothetical protein LUZ63_023605 [Rhynchospora breviuscula]